MKLSISSILVSLLLASVSTASSVFSTRNYPNRQMGPSKGSLPSGAAYFITNEPSGNLVIAAEISSDGTLNLREAIDAGGIGAHGIDAGTPGPDPFFGQGAIEASSAGNIVATVNAGSNTVAVFSIDPLDPTNLKMIGKPVKSGGEFPMSVTINKSGNTVCVLNGGAVNGVSCFKLDRRAGLIPIPNTTRSLGVTQTTPPSGPPGSVSHIIFSEDNLQLMATVKGIAPQPGFMAIWDVAKNGSLSANFKAVAPPQGGLLPFSMTVIAGTEAVLVGDPGIGFDVFDLSTVNGAGKATNSNITAGGRSSANVVPGQGAICWSSFSPKTGNFFLSDAGTSIITEVNVDKNLKASIVKQYPQAQGSVTIDNSVATIGLKDFLYVLAPNVTSIAVLSLDGPGKARGIQTVDISGPAKRSGIKVNAVNLPGMTTFIRK